MTATVKNRKTKLATIDLRGDPLPTLDEARTLFVFVDELIDLGHAISFTPLQYDKKKGGAKYIRIIVDSGTFKWIAESKNMPLAIQSMTEKMLGTTDTELKELDEKRNKVLKKINVLKSVPGI